MRRKVGQALVTIAALAFPLHLVSCSSAQQSDDQLEPTNGEQEGEEAAAQEGAEGQQSADGADAEAQNSGQEENVSNEQTAVEGENTENTANATEGEQSPEEIQEIIADMNQTQGNASSTEAAVPEGQDLAESATPAPDTAATPSAGAAGPALPEFGSKMPYIIQSGDTLAKVSTKVYGTPSRWADIADLSSLPNPSRIFPGDVVYYQLTEETLAFATRYEGLPRQEVTVGAGDTLTSISARVYGSPMDWKILWRHNDNIQDPDRLNPGTVLIYPNTSGISASTDSQNSNQTAQVVTKPTNPVLELSVQATSEGDSRFERSASNLFGVFTKFIEHQA